MVIQWRFAVDDLTHQTRFVDIVIWFVLNHLHCSIVGTLHVIVVRGEITIGMMVSCTLHQHCGPGLIAIDHVVNFA